MLNDGGLIQRWRHLFLVGLGMVVMITFDQGTKIWAQQALAQHAVVVWPVFNLVLVHNTGMAFGLLARRGFVMQLVLIGVSLFVCCVMLYALYRSEIYNKKSCFRWALTCMLAGGVGNIIDRLYRGYVIDFIQLHVHHWFFPVFNMADVLLCVGAFLVGCTYVFDRDSCP